MSALSYTDRSKREVGGSHPFAGCTRLLEQYRQTGSALLTYEKRVCGSLVPTQRHIAEFGQGVAFVPVEVLESYLDDLLDLEASDESLFIKRPRAAAPALALLGIGIAASLYAIVFGPEGYTGLSLPLLVFVFFCAGLGSALYFIPRTRVLRRFSFATVVSRQIASRRGHDRTDMGNFATRLLMREFWSRGEVSGTPNVPAHPARISAQYYH